MVTPRSPATQAPVLDAGVGPADDAPPDTRGLTIGDLAERTGVAPATLRMWERRHGFPVARRQGGGHRRYDERVVDQVRQVLRRREAGSRLEVAIAGVVLAEASTGAAPGAPSVFATLRRLHPTLQPQRLRKSSLLALSWAIEDECCALAETPMIFGAFQKERYYHAAEERWTELARVARSTMVFAHFEQQPPPVVGRTSFVDLPDDAPMRREWAVVCDAPDHAALLAAWELPGQSSVDDKDRLFESIWSGERAAPAAPRRPARAGAGGAVQLGPAGAGPLLYELAEDPSPATVEVL